MKKTTCTSISINPTKPHENFDAEQFLQEASGNIATLYMACLRLAHGVKPMQAHNDEAVRKIIMAYVNAI